MRSWRVIPMREYPNLCVIKEEDGNIIATVQTEYAEKIESLPELIAAGRQHCCQRRLTAGCRSPGHQCDQQPFSRHD